ncbi:RCC1/BLIP-II [Auricularia subglabra TFB-10046 SS5]|nr:RCC1/BLIP-II [Auricularia subglabra TFB-10046 SS5]
MPAVLQDLPVELMLDNLLPYLQLKDLLALAATSKYFTILINDDTFWQRKLESEYNFTSRETARKTGWKAIYRGMHRPQVFVWGASSNGRLGRGELRAHEFVPAPVHPALKPADGAGIVSLAAGGWSFHAIDSKGRLYAWGELNGENWGHRVNGFADSHETAYLPVRLDFGARVQYVTCGRSHALAFDAAGQIWHFPAWGTPLRLVSPALDGSAPDTTLVQLEAGWTFGAALTEGGSVYAWWHGIGELKERIIETTRALAQENPAPADRERVVRCAIADIPFDPVHLPVLPELLRLNGDQRDVKLVKIAAADLFIVGLTNAGHVLKLDITPFRDRQEGNSLAARPLPQWEYLPRYSEQGALAQHPIYSDGSEYAKDLTPPASLTITHISAAFHTFFAYSTGPSSTVLKGGDNTNAAAWPELLPGLQNRDVISVVLGDYHWGALTADGKLLTWGKFSSGALGLGDPFERPPGPGGFASEEARDAFRSMRNRRTDAVQPVAVPTEVDFGPGRFVIAAAAAGWHTGALVLDLENLAPQHDDVQQLLDEAASAHADDLAQWQSPPFNPGGIVGPGPGPATGIVPYPMPGIVRGGGRGAVHRGGSAPRLRGGPGIFRIGFAGRGARIGGASTAFSHRGDVGVPQHEEAGPSTSQTQLQPDSDTPPSDGPAPEDRV